MTQRASASITVDPRAYFGCSFKCPERTEPLKIDGNLKEWGEACHIPDLIGLTAVDAFGEVSMAWGDAGLWLAVEVKGKSTFKVDPRNFWQADCFEIWVDNVETIKMYKFIQSLINVGGANLTRASISINENSLLSAQLTFR